MNTIHTLFAITDEDADRWGQDHRQHLAVARLRTYEYDRRQAGAGGLRPRPRAGRPTMKPNAPDRDGRLVAMVDMEAMLSRLDPQTVICLVMRLVDRHTVPEVAKAAGCSERTVSTRVKDGLAQLTRILEAHAML